MSDTKTPLWKQVLGALSGAAIAFVVYQGYTFTSGHLTALVTLPKGSGIMDYWTGPQQHARPTGTLDSPAASVFSSSASSSSAASAVSAASITDRIFLGPFGSVRGLKKFFLFDPSPVAPASVAAVTADSSSSSRVSPSTADGHVWPTATLNFPTETVVPPSSVPSGRTRPLPSPRSAPAVQARTRTAVTRPIAQQGTVSAPLPSGSMEVASSSRSSRSRPARVLPVAVQASSTSSVRSVPQRTVAHPPATHEQLPQSGFGLDVIAVTALGAVIGRRKMKRS